MKIISKIKEYINTHKNRKQFVNHVVLDKNNKNVIVIKSDYYNMPPSRVKVMLDDLQDQYKADGYDVSFIVI